MRRSLCACTLTTLAVLACEPSATKPDGPAPTSATVHTTSTPPTAVAPPDTTTPITVKPTDSMKDAVSASNAFGLALYQELRTADGNLAYSPASMSLALAMTYAGAKGDTATEMHKTLRLPTSPDALHGGWARVLHDWQGADKVDIAVANRLFGDARYSFDATYLDLTKSRYGAPLESVDFAGAPEAQRKRINDWVADKTRKRIEDLVPRGGVTGDTRMALVNAMYFKAKWQTPFDSQRTETAAFATPAGKADVPMMRQVEYMHHGEVDGVQLAQRAYEDDRFATLFVLPKSGERLEALEGRLDAALLDRWTDALQVERVDMSLPRFKLEPKAPLELSAMLVAMGMPTAFERGVADFTGITNPPNPEDRLFIEKVYHKAFVAMDEAGTEAAAATAVMRRAGGMPAEPKVFEANRPFLFFVRDTKSNLVMFAGRVLDPSK